MKVRELNFSKMIGLFKKKSTERADSMGILMKELKESGISFVDSLNVCSWILLERQCVSFERYVHELKKEELNRTFSVTIFKKTISITFR